MGPAFPLLDHRVHIYKVSPKFSRQKLADGRFTGAHKAGQDDVSGHF